MNQNIFIAHSNKFIDYATWFADFLRSRNLNPIILELMPNYGKSWTVKEKEKFFLDLCDTALIIATPDETQDEKKIPRLDVSYEIGVLCFNKKVIFLKEENTSLPTSLNPVFTSFSLKDPAKCLPALDKELVSIFEGNVNINNPFEKPPPNREPSVYIIDGKDLHPWDRYDIAKVVLDILTREKREQIQIVKDIAKLLDSKDENKRWLAGSFFEELIEYDANLVPLKVILRMTQDSYFGVRASGAVCLHELAEVSPGKVPLDVVIRLANTLKEDWYVFTPSLATLQTLAHKRSKALQALIDMSSQKDGPYIAPMLLRVIENDPFVTNIESLGKLISHNNQTIRSYARDMVAAIEKGRAKKEPSIRYGPF